MSNIFTASEGSYLFISTDDLMSEVKSSISRLGLDSIVRPTTHKNSAIQHMEFRLPELKIDGPAGDSMEVLLRVQNSSIPGTALKVSLGLYRLICANGLFGFSFETIQKIIHRVGPTAQFKLDSLPDAIKNAVNYVDHLSETCNQLAETMIMNPIEIVASLPVPNRTKEAAIGIISSGRYRAEDQPFNAWGLYNIVNEVDRLRTKSSLAQAERDTRLVDDILCLSQSFSDAA